jgi:elongation factor 1-beta
MGITLIKIRIMPTSPEANLEKIKEKIKNVVEANKGKRISFEEQPIAFGLKAIIGFEQDESEGELDPIEHSLSKIEHVSSVQILDMRRAFG